MKEIKNIKSELITRYDNFWNKTIDIIGRVEDLFMRRCLIDFLMDIPNVINDILNRMYNKYFACINLSLGRREGLSKYKIGKICETARAEFTAQLTCFWTIMNYDQYFA